MAMSDDLKTLTIDGRVHTYLTSVFVDEGERLIAALVEKGVPGKLRPGHSYIIRTPEFPGAREKHAERGVVLLASAFAKSGWWARSKRPTGPIRLFDRQAPARRR
jgi:hypothetical protein